MLVGRNVMMRSVLYMLYMCYFFFLNVECKCIKIIYNCLNIINLIFILIYKWKKMFEGNVDKLYFWVYLFFLIKG